MRLVAVAALQLLPRLVPAGARSALASPQPPSAPSSQSRPCSASAASAAPPAALCCSCGGGGKPSGESLCLAKRVAGRLLLLPSPPICIRATRAPCLRQPAWPTAAACPRRPGRGTPQAALLPQRLSSPGRAGWRRRSASSSGRHRRAVPRVQWAEGASAPSRLPATLAWDWERRPARPRPRAASLPPISSGGRRGRKRRKRTGGAALGSPPPPPLVPRRLSASDAAAHSPLTVTAAGRRPPHKRRSAPPRRPLAQPSPAGGVRLQRTLPTQR